MKIAYLGPRGSFCSVVAQEAFPADELLAEPTILDVIDAFEGGKCDFAITPIENSIEGTVNMAVDELFHESSAHVVAEFILPIAQNLLAVSKNQAIERVYSHPQGLAQARQFLRENYPDAKLEAIDSTSAAAEFVKAHPELPIAAVANRAAAQVFGLEIIAENIQDTKDNHTRFWLLGDETPDFALESSGRKVSLALSLPANLPGALHKAISVFAWRNIDMTKIESRPMKTVLGEYFFIIDLAQNPQISYAIEELQSLGITVRVLGDYPVYELGNH